MGHWITKVISASLKASLCAFGDRFLTHLLGRCGVVGGVVVLSVFSFMAMAEAETRSLKLYYVHTNERAEIVFKKDGRYVASGLKKLNHFLRDWRRNEPTNMDPHLFDLVWQIYKESRSRDYIHVVSAYRAPSTNNMLRLKSANSGVAKDSQHTLGKAMDFYIPDVKLEKLRQISLRLEGGGVGYYPKSGSPFIHVDVGNVRHWPRMNRQELLAMFPDGKTIHTPSDGQPLAGYAQAMSARQARKGKTVPVQMARASQGKRSSQATGNDGEKKTLFAALFNKSKNKNKKDKTAEASAPVLVASNQGGGQDEGLVLPSEERAPMPVPSPLRAGQNNRMEEDRRLIAAIVSQQDMAENTVPGDEEIEIASLMAAHAPATQPSTMQPPMPSVKPLPSRKPVDEADAHLPTQLAYMPRLVKNGQKDRDAVGAMNEITSVAHTPATAREDIHTLIAQGDEVEIIPLPDEDLADEGYTTITTLITRSDGSFEEPNSADRDVIRQAIAEAVAALEAADQQTVASISPDSAASRVQATDLAETGLKETGLTQAGEELRQIPDMVFVSTLQNGEEKSDIATLTGRAITFPAIARILDRP